MANNEKLVVTTYIINKGQPSQYFGLKTLEGDVLHYAPNNWKTEQGAYAWAKKKGYIVKDAKIKDNTFDNVKQVYTAQDKNGKVYYVYEGDYKDYKGTRHIFAVSSQTPEYVKSERNVAGTILPTKEEALKQLKMTVRDDGKSVILNNNFRKIKEDGDWTSYQYNGSDFDNAVFKIHQYNPSLIAFVSNGNRTITVRNKYLNDAANANMKTAEDIIKKYGGNPVGNAMGLQKTRFVRQDEIKNQHDFAIDLDKAGYKFYLINGRYRISPKDSSIKDDLTMVEKYKKSIIYIDDNGYYYHTPIGGRGAKAQRDNTKDINIVKKRIDNDYSFLYDSAVKDVSFVTGKNLKVGQKIIENDKIYEVLDIKDNSSIYSKIVTLKDIKTGKVEQLRMGYNYLTEIKDKLIQSSSKEAFSKNMAIEIKSGKDPKQAAAIAYSVQKANDSISQYKPGMDTTGLWQVSHIKNNINQSLLVRANSKEEAINKVVKHSPNSEIIGVNEYPIPHFGEPILDSKIKDINQVLLSNLKKVAQKGDAWWNKWKKLLDMSDKWNSYQWKELRNNDPKKYQLIISNKEYATKEAEALNREWDRVIDALSRDRSFGLPGDYRMDLQSYKSNNNNYPRGTSDSYNHILYGYEQAEKSARAKKGLDSSVKDSLYGAFTMNINSLDDINLTNLVKSIRDYIKQHWNSDIAEINTDDVTTSSGSPKLNFSFREKRSSDKNGRWELSTGTIVIEPSYSLVDKYYTENKKYGEKKLNSEIANRLKQYAHKTIYKNASITRDSAIKDEWSGIRSNGVIFNYSDGKYTITHKNGKVETFPGNKFNTAEELFKYIDNIKDSAIKDAYIDEWWGQSGENPNTVARRYGVSVKQLKRNNDQILYRFEGTIDKLNKMHSDGYFMSIDMAGNSIKDSSIKDAKDIFYRVGTKIKEGNNILVVVKVDDKYVYLKHPNGKTYAYDPYDLSENLKMSPKWSYVDSAIKDADPVKVEKIIRKEKSALGITYYLFQTKSNSGATIYYEVTDKTYHGEPTYSGGGVISFSLQSANDSLDSHLLYDKLVSKYGEKAGRKRFLLGKNDTGIKDAKPYSIKYKNKQYKVYAKDEQTAVEKLNNLLNKVTDKPIK